MNFRKIDPKLKTLEQQAREVHNAYNREYKAKNRDKVNAYQRKWRSENRDKVKAYNQTYWERKAMKQNAEKISEA